VAGKRTPENEKNPFRMEKNKKGGKILKLQQREKKTGGVKQRKRRNKRRNLEGDFSTRLDRRNWENQ